MRKLICMLAVLLLCLSLAVPAFASEGVFVPSITYKDSPSVGDATFGGELSEQPGGEPPVQIPTEKVDGCIVVTSIIQAREKTTDIHEEDRELLLYVHEELIKGNMELSGNVSDQHGGERENPVEKFFRSVWNLFVKEEPKKDGISVKEDGSLQMYFENKEYVIKDLVDVSFQKSDCVGADHLHEEALNHEDIHIEVDFALDVAPDEVVVVLHYHEGKWSPIKQVVNNGDGTLTCTFDHFCPVAFCVEAETAQDAQPGSIIPWVVILLLALAVLLILVSRRKRKSEAAA